MTDLLATIFVACNYDWSWISHSSASWISYFQCFITKHFTPCMACIWNKGCPTFVTMVLPVSYERSDEPHSQHWTKKITYYCRFFSPKNRRTMRTMRMSELSHTLNSESSTCCDSKSSSSSAAIAASTASSFQCSSWPNSPILCP